MPNYGNIKNIADAASKIVGVGATAAAGAKAAQKYIKRQRAPRHLKLLRKGGDVIKDYAYPVAAVGIGAGLASEHIVQPAAQQAQLMYSRNKLKKHVPALEDVDPGVVDNYFNVIKTYSPSTAKNPAVAGALVNKMVEFGGVDHNLVKDMTSIEKATAQSRPATEGVMKQVSRIAEPPME